MLLAKSSTGLTIPSTVPVNANLVCKGLTIGTSISTSPFLYIGFVSPFKGFKVCA